MKKRVQIQNIKSTQILNKYETKHLKGGDGTEEPPREATIIVEDTLIT